MDIQARDRVQLMLTLDRQFMAGIAYYQGVLESGASVIRSGPGLPSLQLDLCARLKSTVLVAVPSFLLQVNEYAKQHSIDLNALAVQKILCIGETIRDASMEYNTLASLIREQWDVQLYATYASTEMQTAFTECAYGKGGHQHPSLIITEIVDEDGNALPAGEFGEVCITTLGVEAMPLLRYRTGDISCYYDTPCACGRKSIRLGPVVGRKKQMIKLKGTTFYPPALSDILHSCSFIDEFQVIVKTNEQGLDDVLLCIATNIAPGDCEQLLKPLLQARLRVIPEICFEAFDVLQQKLIPPGGRKAMRFIDQRSFIQNT